MNELNFPREEQAPDQAICEELHRLGFPTDTEFCLRHVAGDDLEIAHDTPGAGEIIAPLVGEMIEWLRRMGFDHDSLLHYHGRENALWEYPPRVAGDEYCWHAADDDWEETDTHANALGLTCIAVLKAAA